MNKTFQICQRIFKYEKVLQLHFRPSKLHIKYPYILKIRYKEPSPIYQMNSSTEILQESGKFREYTDFTYKYTEKESVKKLIEEIRESIPNCKIYNEVIE